MSKKRKLFLCTKSVVLSVLVFFVAPLMIFATLTEVNRPIEVLATPFLIDATTEYSPSPNVVFIDENVGYMFYVGGTSYSTQTYGIVYNKTTDGGLTWVKQRLIPSPFIEQWANVSVWYDKWTPGGTGTKIHISATEAITDDVWYNTLDTSNDSYDSDGWVQAIAGTRYDNLIDGGVGITKSTDGNLFITGCGTFGTDKCAVYKSTNGDTWSDTTFSTSLGLDDEDKIQLLPLTGGDVLAILQDITSDLVLSVEYDEGSDSWGNQQTIDAAWIDDATYDSTWGASINKSTDNVYLSGMNAINSSTGDLEAYKFTESSRTWSTLTEVVTNRNEILQGAVVADPATNYLYVTFISCAPINDTCTIKYKWSEDDGATWSVPIQISDRPDDIKYVRTSFTAEERLYVNWYNDDLNIIRGNTISTTVSPKSDYTIDGSALTTISQGSQSPNTVFVNGTDGYVFYIDASSDVVYRKTHDGGHEWRDPVVLSPDKTWSNVSVWYDGWTPGDTGTKIHILAVETVTDDVWYYSLDTSTDTLDASGWLAAILGTVVTVSADGPPTIAKSSDGNLFAGACGVLGADGCFVYKSTNGGDNWSNTNFHSATVTDNLDQLQLLPISGGDILAIFQDMSANDIASLEYDEGTDSWVNEQSISSWAENASFDFTWGAASASSSDDVYLVGSNALLSATGDIEAFKFSDSGRTWSTLTPVVQDDEQILQATISVNPDNGDLFAFYVKGENPYDVHTSLVFGGNVYMKSSSDDGVTWSSATKLNSLSSDIRNVNRDMHASYGSAYSTWFNIKYLSVLGRRISATSPTATNIPREQLTGEAGIVDATDEYNPSPNIVFIDANVGYMFFVGGDLYNTADYEVSYKKTTDGGANWSSQIAIESYGMDGAANVSVWYDGWTPGDTGSKIHISAVEVTTDDVWYNSIDTDDDSFDSDSWIPVIAGTSYSPTGHGGVGITKSSDGNLFLTGCGVFSSNGCLVYKSTNGNTWSDTALTLASGIFSSDSIQLLPLTGGDILAIYQDISENKVVSKEYDEGTDSWTNEQTIDASWVVNALYDSTWGASLNGSTNNIYLAGMNAIDTSTGDLEAYKFTESSRTWTTLTEIVTDTPRVLQGSMIVDSDTGYLYVAYLNCPTLQDDCSALYRKSTDDGTTWSNPVQLSDTPDDFKNIRTSFVAENNIYVDWFNDDLNTIHGNNISKVTEEYSDYTLNGNVLAAVSQRSQSPNVVFTDFDNGYVFYVESTSDVVYRKTTDGGYRWGDIHVLSPDKTWNDVSIWYDGWTPSDTGTKIHIVATETATDDVWYYSLDTSDDSLDPSGWVAVVLGTTVTTAVDGAESIAKSTDGNLFAGACGILVGDGCYVYKSDDGGDTWTNTNFNSATVTDNLDQYQLLPISGGDILAIFQDMSANDVASLEYDEATDTWGNEQSISSWAENASYDSTWGASINSSTGDAFLVGMNAINSATGDLEFFQFASSTRTWTTRTPVVTDDIGTMQGVVAVNPSNNRIFVTYAQADHIGAAEPYDAIVYAVYSDNSGVSWSSPVQVSIYPSDIRNVRSNFNSLYGFYVNWFNINTADFLGRMVDDGEDTGPVYSVSISTDGVIEYGFVNLNSSTTTIGSFTQTALNDGFVDEKLNIKSSDAVGGTNWTLATTTASDQYTHEFSTTTGATWTIMPDTSTYVTAVPSLSFSGTADFDFRLTAPTLSTDDVEKTINITIQAVAP